MKLQMVSKTVLTVSLEGGEGLCASKLQVLRSSASGERRSLGHRRGLSRHGLRAIDELGGVLAGDGELLHGRLEVRRHQVLVVDVLLPEAGRARVAGEFAVGLETHLTLGRERGEGFAGVVGGAWDAGALEEDLEEDLSVEGEWRAVEGDGADGGIDVVGTGDGVGREEVNEVGWGETGVGHAGQDGGDVLLGLGDGAIGRRDGGIGTAGRETEARSTGAVGKSDGTGELDEIASGEGRELGQERRESVHRVINTEIGREVGLDGVEDDHGAVSTSAPTSQGELKEPSVEKLHKLESTRLGEANGIVEGQPNDLVDYIHGKHSICFDCCNCLPSSPQTVPKS